MTLHSQVEIEHEGIRAEVDEGLAPLILALWQRGFRTIASCEAQAGTGTAVVVAGGIDIVPVAWIGFVNREEAERFRRLAGLERSALKIPEPVDYEGLTEEQIASSPPGSASVGFPSSKIAAVLDAVNSAQL